MKVNLFQESQPLISHIHMVVSELFDGYSIVIEESERD